MKTTVLTLIFATLTARPVAAETYKYAGTLNLVKAQSTGDLSSAPRTLATRFSVVRAGRGWRFQTSKLNFACSGDRRDTWTGFQTFYIMLAGVRCTSRYFATFQNPKNVSATLFSNDISCRDGSHAYLSYFGGVKAVR